MGLMQQVKNALLGKQMTAAEQYRDLCRRRENPQPGDAEKLVEVMSILNRKIDDLEEDAAVLAQAEQLAAQVVRLPLATLEQARYAARLRAVDARLKERLAAAEQDAETARVQLKNEFAASLNLAAQARFAEAALNQLFPQIREILGQDAALESFGSLYSPGAVSAAFAQAKNEALTTGVGSC